MTEHGGRFGIASQDRLIAVVEAPQQVLFGAEIYLDVPGKAAALVFLLLKSRPFVGANETTALLVMLRFLAVNGHQLSDSVDNNDLLWIVRSINHADLQREGLEAWLRRNTQL